MTDFETLPIGTADRIKQLEAKLAKAVERLKTMADYNKYVIAPFLAELEKKE